ncbi:MAG: YifB family Mg chelatase-like AAA ATPase [Oscillospiraceae bacterium]|nr:YifB family Mg chelatase-like AAA ATPase [Oscillospiraceae bacterium]
MYASLYSMGLIGIDGCVVTVEADSSPGQFLFEVVGLPDAAVREARERVRSAMRNSGLQFPSGRMIVNLAPADIRKVGPAFDLPILICVALASEALVAPNIDLSKSVIFGEISVSGDVRPIPGALPMTIEAKRHGFTSVFLPEENADEASYVEGIDIYPVASVRQLVDHLCGRRKIEPKPHRTPDPKRHYSDMLDFADVKGQLVPRRAAEICAAGGHNMLLIGGPGCGKSMICSRLPSIMPDMTSDEIIETTKIYSIVHALSKEEPVMDHRPFRSPHHTISAVALAGGGTIPRPGEVSLAHNGVLYFDEVPQFDRVALEALRQPLEDNKVTISRATGQLTFPCSTIFVCSMNPCPCGHFGQPNAKCTCSESAITRYLGRISGPLLDRMDLHVDVLPVDFDKLSGNERSESSAEIRVRTNAARKIQQQRYAGTGVSCNAKMTGAQQREFCQLDEKSAKLLRNAFDRLGLSARAYDRIVRVARTIADLDGSENIRAEHVAEAISYRSLDRKYWKRT